jgi:AcrR family transcriptional regulator
MTMDPARETLHPTKQAILQVAIQELNEQGQGGFRISHVIEQSNSSFSSLYHHFGSREGLLREANAERFVWSAEANRKNLAPFAEAALQCTTTEEVLDLGVMLILQIAHHPFVRQSSRQRIEVLGFALTDPELLDIVTPREKESFDFLSSIISGLQRRGLIRQDLNIESYVAWLTGMHAGRLLMEIDPTFSPAASTWDKCAILATLQPLTLDHEPLEWSPSWESSAPELPRLFVPSPAEGSRKVSDHPTAKALIKNTIEILETEGEEAVRLPRVLEGTGTSVTSIYHFFGNREGLLVAANAARFIQRSHQVALDFTATAKAAKTANDFLAFLKMNLAVNSQNEAFIKWRWNRVEVLGAGLHRPELLTSIVVHQRSIIDQFASIIKDAQQQGFVREDIDPAVSSIWYQGMTFGRILTEIQPELNQNEEWLDLAIEGTQAVVRPVS